VRLLLRHETGRSPGSSAFCNGKEPEGKRALPGTLDSQGQGETAFSMKKLVYIASCYRKLPVSLSVGKGQATQACLPTLASSIPPKHLHNGAPVGFSDSMCWFL
jgi:hypothetical protein